MLKKAIIAGLLAMSLAGCGSSTVITTHNYTVSSGDTVYSIATDIARKHADKRIDINRLAYDIKQANNIRDGYIVPGQVLKVPKI